MTAPVDVVADLTRQDLEADLDLAEERAKEWRDQARWCDSLPERDRCEERAAQFDAKAAALRERLGR